jgi:hypothetical protein
LYFKPLPQGQGSLRPKTDANLSGAPFEDDLRAIAKRGYEGAVTTELDQQAQAVGLFLTDALLQIWRG